ncbi:MAG: phosphonate C-P lyase system protein PhnL [Kiritimatiellia bacterium]
MLTVTNLSKTFTIHQLQGKQIEGVPPVSFDVGPGKSLALSGPSGTGKSSILKCLYRTYLPTTGTVAYQTADGNQVDLATLPETDMVRLRRQEIGYVTQFLRVIPRVPATGVVADPLLQRGMPAEEALDQAAALLRRLRIPDELLDAYPVTFSGGEQQRVNIARAVISRPRLLLLDEPTASLDKASVSIVIDLLKELQSTGTTMVMIFHDPDLMHALADDVLSITPRQELHA